jgi:hypothetical protein
MFKTNRQLSKHYAKAAEIWLFFLNTAVETGA